MTLDNQGLAVANSAVCVPAFPRSRVPAFPRSRVPAFLRSCVPAFLRSCVPAFLRSCVPAFCVPAFLRSAFCVLRSAFCVLRSAFCVLRSAFCVLRSAFCVLRSAFCVLRLRSAFCVGRWALGVGRWALGVGRWALGVGRWALGVGRWALGVGRWALGVALQRSSRAAETAEGSLQGTARLPCRRRGSQPEPLVGGCQSWQHEIACGAPANLGCHRNAKRRRTVRPLSFPVALNPLTAGSFPLTLRAFVSRYSAFQPVIVRAGQRTRLPWVAGGKHRAD